MDEDRVKLLIAAAAGAVLGIVTGYLLGHGWLNIVIWALMAQSLLAGRSIVIGLFVSPLPSPRRFPPPWSIEERDTCFVVKDKFEPMWSISDGRTSAQRRPQCLRGDLSG
jgi:hypothetical protein